ncbi:MAG TPA: hypothetical protein VIB79_04210 [Candidatus Binatia bacterium]|jgi:hypothetical protein
MLSSKAVLLAAFLSSFTVNLPAAATAAEFGHNKNDCRRGDRIRIQDLDMSPDPVVEGRLVRSWRLRLNFEGRRECETDITIREGNNTIGQRHFRLRPGVNEVEVVPSQGFRFRGREMCFNVLVDLEGSRHQLDADRRFCASQRTVWSLREPDDRAR